MERLTSIDDMLNKAFLLAYFIHGDKETAVRIVAGAMAKLDVAATAQGKRLYYKPAGRALLRRSRLDQFRSKVVFSELHLLQRLIYIESEPYEKQKEQASRIAAVRKEDLLVHFIKHLVRITLKRNSFYVTLGTSRLLYNYTTSETMGIYNVVVQDPERVKDDYYYRSRKGVLMQEIKERFGDLVRICHGQRGEERFQAEPDPGRFSELVRECLSFFTPWATPCLIPADFDPIVESIPSLLFQGKGKEDKIEVNRIHAALHPTCYQRLVMALGFHAPDQRLEVPYFFPSNENGDRNEGRRERSSNLELGPEDLNTIKNDLDELARRRRRASAGLLRVVVDGVEHARLDVRSAPRVRFNLDRQRELLEVWTADEDGPLLLASSLLPDQEPGQAQTTKASIALEGGQSLSIVISASGDASSQVVEIGYQELSPIKASALMLRQFVTAPVVGQWLFAGSLRWFEERRFKVLTSVSAFIFLLIVAAGAVTYLRREENEGYSRAVTNGAETQRLPLQAEKPTPGTNVSASATSKPLSSPQQPGTIGQPGVQGSRSTQFPPSQNSGLIVRKKPLPNGATAGHQASVKPEVTEPETVSREEEVTRALRTSEKHLSLLDVKTVFLEMVENEASDQILREMLVKQFQTSDRLTLAKNRAEADALLRVSPSQAHTRKDDRGQSVRSAFVVQLINAQGQVIWPLKGPSFNRTYSGPTEQVSAQILRDLLHDIEGSKQRH